MKEEHTHKKTRIVTEREESKKVLTIALSITFLMFFAEVIGGLLSNSLALLSDAFHMLVDTSAIAISLFAVVVAARPATSKKTYGFYRMEILAALLNGAVLLGVCAYIFYEAYQRFIEPQPIKSSLMLAVASVGLVANLAGAFVLYRKQSETLNVRGAFLHIVGDTLSSVGVIVGGVIILFTKWFIIDPLISILIGVVIVRGAWGLLKESVDILLEAVPRGIDLDRVISDIEKVKGIREAHDVHIWTITSGIYALSAHLLIDDLLVSHSAEILEQVNEMLRRKYSITHTTIQFECKSCEEGGIVCQLEKERNNQRKSV